MLYSTLIKENIKNRIGEQTIGTILFGIANCVYRVMTELCIVIDQMHYTLPRQFLRRMQPKFLKTLGHSEARRQK